MKTNKILNKISRVPERFFKLSLPVKIGISIAAAALIVGTTAVIVVLNHKPVSAQLSQVNAISSMSVSSGVSESQSSSETSNQEISTPVSSSQPEKVEVTGISLSKTTVSLTVGQKTMPIVTMTPKDATDKGEIWESSNTKVATVDQSGNIKAVGVGSCTVTVTSASNKDVSNKVNVTVAEAIDPQYVAADFIGMTAKDFLKAVNNQYEVGPSLEGAQGFTSKALYPNCIFCFPQIDESGATMPVNAFPTDNRKMTSVYAKGNVKVTKDLYADLTVSQLEQITGKTYTFEFNGEDSNYQVNIQLTDKPVMLHYHYQTESKTVKADYMRAGLSK